MEIKSITKASKASTSSTKTSSAPKTSAPSSNSNAMAQQAVAKGYVKSVDEYNSAVKSGQDGAKYGYSSSGSGSKKTYTANTSFKDPVIGAAEAQNIVTPLEIPPTPTPVNYNSEIESGNTMTGLNADGTTKPVAQKNTYDAILADYGIEPPPEIESVGDAYLKAEKAYDIRKKEDAVNNYSSQLNAIVAKSQADQLSVEGQGRGITEAIIGGQQAQISKEAAIRALPVQAQLAAAQGNLEVAQKRLDTYYNIVSQDIQNKYAYKMKLFDMAFSIANQKQQNLIEDKRSETAFSRQKEMTYLDNDLALKRDAIQFGYSKSLKQMDTTNQVGLGQLSEQVNAIFQNGESNTPATTKSVLAGLLGSKAITAGTRAKLAPAVEVLNSLDEFANSNLEGKFIGSGGFLGFSKLKEGVKGIFNMKNPEAIANKQQIDAVNLKVQQWASGASLTEQQTKQVDDLTPTTWDSDKEIRTKTSQLYNFMVNQAEGNLLTEGINVQFPQVNLFEIRDLYNKATPEQKKELKALYPSLK